MNAQQRQLIKARTACLRKDSRWYANDYAAIEKAVLKMTPKQLAESAARQRAIGAVTDKEINANCQV